MRVVIAVAARKVVALAAEEGIVSVRIALLVATAGVVEISYPLPLLPPLLISPRAPLHLPRAP